MLQNLRFPSAPVLPLFSKDGKAGMRKKTLGKAMNERLFYLKKTHYGTTYRKSASPVTRL